MNLTANQKEARELRKGRIFGLSEEMCREICKIVGVPGRGNIYHLS